MVHLHDLAVLLQVAQSGSISGAARALAYSQSTVSRRIARLEDVYGARLVSRERSASPLTPKGEQVAAFARDILDRHMTLVETLQRGPQLAGLIRIVSSTAPAAILPGMIARFTARHPSVEFDVAVTDSTEVTRAILDQRAHVGFCGQRLAHPKLDYRAMAQDEIVLIVGESHRFASWDHVTMEELRSEQFVLREDGSGTQATFFERLAQVGHSSTFVHGSVTVHTADALLDAVRAGLGVGIASRHTLDGHPSGLAAVRLPELSLKRTLWLVLSRGRHQPDRVKAFIDWIDEVGLD